MTFLDRLTGLKIELPDPVIPGRYTLASPVPGGTLPRLEPGDPLLDDGSGICRWENARREFARFEPEPDEAAKAELTADAVRVIADESRRLPRVSPMLPAEVASQRELLSIEMRLDEVLGKGHLHSISERPRLDVHYEEAVLDVGRVRRMARGALTHLTSHSDCWQRKTPNGIEPRRILARFSEDDYTIYENCLYARLLDALQRHLIARIAKVRGLTERLEAALEFQHSEWTHHRLLHRVCTLWGDAFSEGSASLEASRATFGTLVRHLKAIKSLKQQGLYTAIPRYSQVGGQVHRTDILNHDPHYRHLPPLWEGLREERAEGRVRPEEALAKARQAYDDYSEYVGLVLCRALDHFVPSPTPDGFRFHWPGGEGTVTRLGSDWRLQAEGAQTLLIVPLFWFGGLGTVAAVPEGTVLCTPEIPDDAPGWWIRASPLDLHVVERLGRILDRQLIEGPASRYGCSLGPVPTTVTTLLVGWKEFVRTQRSPPKFRLREVLPIERKEVLFRELELHAARELIEEFRLAVSGVDALAQCLSCLRVGDLTPWADGFHAECRSCRISWEINTVDGRRRLFRRPEGSPEEGVDPVAWAGRDWEDLELPTHAPAGRI